MKKTSSTLNLILLFVLLPSSLVWAEQNTVNINASSLVSKIAIFPSPAAGTFLEGSVFEIPIYANTNGVNINTIDLQINFDPAKLAIVRPSGDKSIIGVWLEPPTYSNTKGTARLVGIIPNGIVTDSGLIAAITFKAIAIGQAKVTIAQATRVLANDGIGTELATEFKRGIYNITPQPPAGPRVFSETHSFENHWYNNPNPVLAWDKDSGITAFSYVLDNMPFTVPENVSSTADTVKAYENLKDGLWYFHIKALKQGVWGAATHFLVKIDTTPPAEFTPTVDFVTASVINRYLVSFFTTDNLSGIDHYEIGVIEKNKSTEESPVFIQTESPYQLPVLSSNDLRVIVRAFDKAGNARDANIDISMPFPLFKFLKDNLANILLSLISLILAYSLFHYLFGHRIISRTRKAFRIVKEEEKIQKESIDENLDKLVDEKGNGNSKFPPTPPAPRTIIG